MNKEKTLLLIEGDPNKQIFFYDWINNGYHADIIYKKVSKPLRAIRRIFVKNNLPLNNLWLNSWFNDLSLYDTVIIHMNNLTRYLPKIIVDKYPNIRVIGWYWNTITEDSKPIDFNNSNIEYWSFDEEDCKNYNLHKNIQYYVPFDSMKKEITNDVYFIGRNKGREEQINTIKKELEEKGLKCNFYIISDNSNEIIPYSEVRKELLKTKAILEINKENQTGLTLRALESLFYEIKLITNNRNIKNIPFYNKDNIFVVGEDNIVDFLNSKYNTEINKYKKDYCLESWISNFE